MTTKLIGKNQALHILATEVIECLESFFVKLAINDSGEARVTMEDSV